MLRTVLCQQVVRQLSELVRREFLQAGFVVAGESAVEDLVDPRLEQVQHECRGCADATIEVDPADDCFHPIGEDGRLVTPAGGLLALAERQCGAELHGSGDLGERGRAHQLGPMPGEHALTRVGRCPEQVIGHDEPEHGVSEELEALIRRDSAVLGTPRSVAKREIEPRRVGEPVAEQTTEFLAGVDVVALRAW